MKGIFKEKQNEFGEPRKLHFYEFDFFNRKEININIVRGHNDNLALGIFLNIQSKAILFYLMSLLKVPN